MGSSCGGTAEIVIVWGLFISALIMLYGSAILNRIGKGK